MVYYSTHMVNKRHEYLPSSINFMSAYFSFYVDEDVIEASHHNRMRQTMKREMTNLIYYLVRRKSTYYIIRVLSGKSFISP